MREGWTYIVLLFQLGMHSRIDGRSGVEPGCDELERGIVSMWEKKRWTQSEQVEMQLSSASHCLMTPLTTMTPTRTRSTVSADPSLVPPHILLPTDIHAPPRNSLPPPRRL